MFSASTNSYSTISPTRPPFDTSDPWFRRPAVLSAFVALVLFSLASVNMLFGRATSERELQLWEADIQLRKEELELKKKELSMHEASHDESTNSCGTAPGGCIGKGKFDTLVFSDDFDTFDLSKWKHELTMGGGGNWEFEYYVNNRTNSFVKDGVLHMKPTFTSDTIGEENVKGNNYVMDMWGSSPADQCTGNAFYGCSRTAGAGGNYINPIQSARLRTAETFNFQYGRVEIRAQLPKGDWIWPALWMVPTNQDYGQWPASGEIDIMESRGNAPGYSAGGRDTMGSTLHWGPHWPSDPYQLTHGEMTLKSGDFSDGFHTFGLYWDETTMYTYVDTDDNRVLEVPITESFFTKGGWNPDTTHNPWEGRGNNAPFDRSFFLIMNVAVGGVNEYFPDTPEKPWGTSSAHAVNEFWDSKDSTWGKTWVGEDVAMKIDSVKVWQ